MDISTIADDYAVTAQISPDDIVEIAASGFVAVICNRPDGEQMNQPSAADIEKACADKGVAFHHVPVSGAPSQDQVHTQQKILGECDGPVLGYCGSGNRARNVYIAGKAGQF